MKDMGAAATARHVADLGEQMNSPEKFREMCDFAEHVTPHIFRAALNLAAGFNATREHEVERGLDGSSFLVGFVMAWHMLLRAETEPYEIDNLFVTVVPTERPR